MKNLKSVSFLFILATAFTFGACSQDETMDEVIDNTEISSPSSSSTGEDSSETDKPGG